MKKPVLCAAAALLALTCGLSACKRNDSRDLGDKIDDGLDSVSEGASKVGEKVSEGLSDAGEKLSEGASKVGEKVSEGMSDAADAARDAVTNASERLDEYGRVSDASDENRE